MVLYKELYWLTPWFHLSEIMADKLFLCSLSFEFEWGGLDHIFFTGGGLHMSLSEVLPDILLWLLFPSNSFPDLKSAFPSELLEGGILISLMLGNWAERGLQESY